MVPIIPLGNLSLDLISAASLNVFCVDVPTKSGIVRFECEQEPGDHWKAYADRRPPIVESSLFSLVNALYRRSTLKRL